MVAKARPEAEKGDGGTELSACAWPPAKATAMHACHHVPLEHSVLGLQHCHISYVTYGCARMHISRQLLVLLCVRWKDEGS
eukprot:365917-Chlamydomonas_euryale.AAC.19